ncbi:MAG: pyrroline-5-carboxylate reductase family protein [Lawsonibacter sp.]
MFSSIGFIGTGTMGAAVARAAVKGAQGAPVLLANRTRSKAEAVARELGAQTADNETVARECSLIFLGVKPQMMEQMLSGLVPILKARKDRFVLASMAAGLDARRIQEMAGGAMSGDLPDAQHSGGQWGPGWCSTAGWTPLRRSCPTSRTCCPLRG